MTRKGGRPPTRPSLKVLRGTNRRDRERETVEVEPGTPEMPEWLADSDVPWGRQAAREWRRIVETMAPWEILSEADRDLVAAHADAVARWVFWRREAARVGAVQTTRTGYTAPSGESVLARQAYGDAQKTGAALGLAPSERLRLAKPRRDSDNSFNKLRRGRAS